MNFKDYEYCSNCKHFHQHYVNIKNLGLRQTTCGHCSEYKIKYGCGHFEKLDKLENCEEDINIINLLITTKNHLQYFISNLEQLETELRKNLK